jgi:hypothetical protein
MHIVAAISMELVGCRRCALVRQVPEGSAVAPGRCGECTAPLALLSSDEAQALLRRRLAEQRIHRLSQATVAQQLHLARSRPRRVAGPPTSAA